jgi:prevent-host-death family protein
MWCMPDTVVNIHAAKTHLSRLVARAEKGERIVIARDGKPVAQLGPAPRAKRRKTPPDDPLLNLERFAFDGPGGRLTNAQIDRLVYGA